MARGERADAGPSLEEADERAAASREGADARAAASLEGADERSSPAPVESRGDRKAATQERILRAATELFLTRGYKGTSIANVAEQAKVSRSAVFWHFDSKTKLFHEVCRDLLVPFREGVEHNLQHLDPQKRLHEVVALYEAFEEENRATIQQFVRWSYGDDLPQGPLRQELLALHGVFLRDVEEALVELGEKPEDAAALAAALVSLLDGNLLLRLIDPSEEAAARRRAGVEAIVAGILERRR